MTDRNANFHRLAQKRIEALIDQIRVFSNLSGPSYHWTADEVWDYFAQITKALEEALARFQEQKRFQLSQGEPVTPPPSTAPADAEEIEDLKAMLAHQRAIIEQLQVKLDECRNKNRS